LIDLSVDFSKKKKKQNTILCTAHMSSFDPSPSISSPPSASDPYARFLSASCLDLLLIELVPMAERVAAELSPPATTTTTMTTATVTVDEEEQREAAFYRLESLGYRVGQGLAER
jgi:trafficking protein particle complex subunit 6